MVTQRSGVELHALETLEGEAPAFRLLRVAGIRQRLEFIEDEARHDEGTAQETGRAQFGEPSIDDDVESMRSGASCTVACRKRTYG